MSRACPLPRRHAGFTLIEVLLATVLLAGGLTLAFSTVRSAMAVSSRGEAMAERSERVRAVEGFLRQRLAGALPLAIEADPATLQVQRFLGEPQRMRFVADVPDYLGRGGPYVHELTLSGSPGRQRLQLQLTMLQAGQTIEEARPLPAETLADDLREVRLRYRGLDPRSGELGPWVEQWEDPGTLPLLVSVAIRAADGSAWPTLVVALPQAGNVGARS